MSGDSCMIEANDLFHYGTFMFSSIYFWICYLCYVIYHLSTVTVTAMHRVGSAGNTNNSTRPRKEKRLTYVLNDSDYSKVNPLFFYSICSMKMVKFHVC